MHSKIFLGIVSFLTLFWGTSLMSQIAGNPVETKGEGEWTISAAGTYLHQQLGHETVLSNRWLVKSGWGVTDDIDLYGLCGVVKLNMNAGEKNISEYHGEYEFGYGLGFNMILQAITKENNMGIWVGAQALRFPSSGKFIETYQTSSENLFHEYEMQYAWNEVHACLGIIYPYQHFRFYLSGAGYLVQRDDKKTEYILYGADRTYWGEEQDEYRSGLWTGVLVGFDINLSNNYVFSVEGLIFNSSNYQIKIGICQTGGKEW
jgi:hypothetical protein